jgi:hypothetical protein
MAKLSIMHNGGERLALQNVHDKALAAAFRADYFISDLVVPFRDGHKHDGCGVAGAAVATSADGTKLAAIAQANGIFVSTNGGATWGKAAGIPAYYWKYLTFSADGSKLIVLSPDSLQGTLPGPMYMSTDSGATWTSNNVSSQPWLTVASSANGERLVATASMGAVFTSNDGGSTWISNNVPNSYFGYLAELASKSEVFTVVWHHAGGYERGADGG